jgi:hypothetical protein
LKAAGELLLAHHFAVGRGHLAVAKDVERDRHEALLNPRGDLRLAEVHLDHALAVGTAVLLEVEDDALVLLRRIGDLLRQDEQRLCEPRRQFLGVSVKETKRRAKSHVRMPSV